MDSYNESNDLHVSDLEQYQKFLELSERLKGPAAIYGSLVGILGVLANLVVIFILTKKLRTITNLLLASISASDILLLVCGPISTVYGDDYDYNSNWFKFIILNAFEGSFCISVCVSTWTSTLVAYFRFRMIVQQLPVIDKLDSAFKYNCIIWGISVLLVFPRYLTEWVYKYTNQAHNMADVVILTTRITRGGEFIVTYFLPILATSFFYMQVCHVINKISRPNANQGQRQRELLAKKRRIFMLIGMVVVFTVLWLPTQVRSVIQVNDILPSVEMAIASFVSTILHTLSCLVNPLIFYFFDNQFKLNVQKYLVRMKILKKTNVSKEYSGASSFKSTANTVTTV